MKRIIFHWTGGPNKVTALDKEHYHFIIDGDGVVHEGDKPVSANAAPVKAGKYAAHTLNCNTDSIGVSIAGMLNAVENKTNGSQPINEKQFEAMCAVGAKLCFAHKIPNTDKTLLTHAEVQPNLGIKQRGKWDITVLPFKPELRGARACGDYMRNRIASHYKGMYGSKTVVPVTVAKPTAVSVPMTAPVIETKKVSWFASLISFFKGNKNA